MLFLETGKIIVDNATMFHFITEHDDFNPPESLLEEKSSLALRGLYFEKGRQKVILDPGPGKWISTFFPGYRFSSLRNACDLVEKEGIPPGRITDIVLTHLHFDHCAGIFIQEGELLLPAFPGAMLHISRAQIDLVDHPSTDEKDSFLPGFTQLIHKYYDVNLCDEQTVPAFLDDLIFSNGHTKGMILPVFTHEGRKYIYVSDLIPTQANLIPEVVSGYDTDPELLFREKLEFFSTHGTTDCQVIFFHEPDHRQRVVKLPVNGDGV